MKLLQRFVLLGSAIFVTALTAHTQAANSAKLKINGVIGLRSTYEQVVKAFGSPTNETKASMEQCTGGYEKTAEYSGAMFYFMSGTSKDGKTFEVESFIVNSPKLTVSGVKVGDTEATVKRKFGGRYKVAKDDKTGAKTWIYEMGDRDGPGQTIVSFKNGKVARISSSITLC